MHLKSKCWDSILMLPNWRLVLQQLCWQTDPRFKLPVCNQGLVCTKIQEPLTQGSSCQFGNPGLVWQKIKEPATHGSSGQFSNQGLVWQKIKEPATRGSSGQFRLQTFPEQWGLNLGFWQKSQEPLTPGLATKATHYAKHLLRYKRTGLVY